MDANLTNVGNANQQYKVKRRFKTPKMSSCLINGFFIIYSLLCIIPVVLAISISISDEGLLLKHGYKMIPKQISFDAYLYIMHNSKAILNAYSVTTVATIVGTIASVLVIVFYAYPISRKDFRYKNFFTFIMFITMVFNGGLVPWYLVCTKMLHIQNTIWALILPHIFNAWYIIIMRTFFTINIPDALIEAAKIDGCGEMRLFWKIVFPLSLPGVATIALFQTLGYWNDWWLPLMLITKDKLNNIQYLSYRLLTNIQELSQGANTSGDVSALMAQMPAESARMALCIISVGPIIFAYPFFQKYFVQGLTVGAVKG